MAAFSVSGRRQRGKGWSLAAAVRIADALNLPSGVVFIPELQARLGRQCVPARSALQLWADVGCDEFEVIQVVRIDGMPVDPGDAVLGESTYPVDHLIRGTGRGC